MKKEKINKKSKKILLLILIVVIVIALAVLLVIYFKSDKFEVKKLEKQLIADAEKYYTEEFIKVASSYMKEEKQVSINLETLKDYGIDITKFKNEKTGKVCSDTGTYVTIYADMSKSDDFLKNYKIKKVVIDCFDYTSEK